MAEDQGEHRREIESRVIDGNIEAQKRGQYCALALGLAGAVLAGILFFQGEVGFGIFLFLSDLLALALAFVLQPKRDREELQEKQQNFREGDSSEQQRELSLDEASD